jgi:hypothetical protein
MKIIEIKRLADIRPDQKLILWKEFRIMGARIFRFDIKIPSQRVAFYDQNDYF